MPIVQVVSTIQIVLEEQSALLFDDFLAKSVMGLSLGHWDMSIKKSECLNVWLISSCFPQPNQEFKFYTDYFVDLEEIKQYNSLARLHYSSLSPSFSPSCSSTN